MKRYLSVFIGIFSLLILISCSSNYSENTKSEVMDEYEFFGKPEEYVVKKLGKPNQVMELGAINKCWYIYNSPKIVKCNMLKIRFSNWIPQEGIVDKVNCN